MKQERDDVGPVVDLPPHPVLPEFYEASRDRQEFLNALFDRTASWYRIVDKAIGFGLSIYHRRRSLRDAGLSPGMAVLDVACGSGLTTQGALRLVGPTGLVVGLDPSTGMLNEAKRGPSHHLVQGVGERLPFPDASFDFLSMGYALRHVSDLGVAFREFRRVLRPGGIVLLLEISRPRWAPFRSVTRFYIRTVLGVSVATATGNPDMRTLMRYWWDTIESCAPPEAILSALAEAGFVQCGVGERINGLLRSYRAVRPDLPRSPGRRSVGGGS
jgi:demethylmenaquinone methyltransferase / 2-methoxy-6-polyprenyl-1,4-benzoquinol methylase